MNITPERALELASVEEGTAKIWSNAAKAGADEASGHSSYHADIAAILRRYAEIAPKWQAVQGAPAVAVVCNPGAFVKIDWTAEPVTTCQPFRESDRVVQLQDGVPVGAQLIIKPAP